MSPTRMSKLESAMRVVLKFSEAFNRHDLQQMMLLISDDCFFEQAAPAPDGTRYSGAASIAQHLQESFQQSPGLQIEIEEIFGLGERCIMRWRCRWQDEEDELGYIRGVDIFRVRDGFIRERFSYVKGQATVG